MDDRHVMRLIKASERIAVSLERIDKTLTAMHESDPVKLIGDALATDSQINVGVTVPLDAQQTTTHAVDPNYVKPPEWMTR